MARHTIDEKSVMSEKNRLYYHIAPSSPSAHLFKVSCTIHEPDPDGQRLSLPAWIPGSYMIRDFARNIVQISAQAGSKRVAMEKLDKQTWLCAPCDGPLVVEYEVYAWDLSVRSAHLDTTHGYFNGTSVFLQVHGRESCECVVEISPPLGEQYRGWRVATAMKTADAQSYGFGTYCASDYDELLDHPVEMGDFEVATFEVAGIPHDIVISGRHRADMKRLCRDLQKICECHVGLFGELPLMDRYLFLVMVVGEGYGGLEHRASCSLLCSREDLPLRKDDAVSERYRTFLGLCSHEYFHTWNVKRIKPAVFVPYDLGREVYTRLLWAFEGVTSYYDDLSLVRCGLITAESYLELVGQNITRVLRGTGRFRQSISDSSFDAWTRFYKQDENAPNAIVSYYAKGAMVALALDLTIRRETQQRSSLDDVMRVLWQRYGRTAIGIGEQELERVIEEVSGVALHTFFDQTLRGTEDIPLEPLLEDIGVLMKLRPAQSDEDKGGTPPKEGEKRRIVLGARYRSCDGGVELTHVLEHGAAQQAGLAAGDVLVAIDGLRVSTASLEACLCRYEAGDPVRVHAFRRDELMEFSVVLQESPMDSCYLQPMTDMPEPAGRRYSEWLGLPDKGASRVEAGPV